jgi:hypothetical protein
MAAETHGQDDNLSARQKVDLPAEGVRPESQPSTQEAKLTYTVILRHREKLRDGARVVLAFFESPGAGETSTAIAVPIPPASSAGGPAAAGSEPIKTLMERRIERHMGLVDQALNQIQSLNPDRKKRVELPAKVRELIVKKERTIRDIVNAEIHYWAATIQNNPLTKFDSTEQAWIFRILRLVNALGVEPNHKEHLAFVRDWASHKHH